MLRNALPYLALIPVLSIFYTLLNLVMGWLKPSLFSGWDFKDTFMTYLLSSSLFVAIFILIANSSSLLRVFYGLAVFLVTCGLVLKFYFDYSDLDVMYNLLYFLAAFFVILLFLKLLSNLYNVKDNSLICIATVLVLAFSSIYLSYHIYNEISFAQIIGWMLVSGAFMSSSVFLAHSAFKYRSNKKEEDAIGSQFSVSSIMSSGSDR